ncbi:hypothetical protein EMCRGX_G014715 [Ephydatia muelleri]
MGLETADIAMERKKMKAAAVKLELSGRAVKVFAVDWEAAAAVNQLEEVIVPVLRWKWGNTGCDEDGKSELCSEATGGAPEFEHRFRFEG